MKNELIVLVILMALDILLGAIIGWRKKEFDKEILFSGIQKVIVIFVASGGLLLVANLMPDLGVILNGQELLIKTALYILVHAEIAWYVVEVFLKLISVLSSKSKDAMIEPLDDAGAYLRDDDEVGLG